MHRVIRRTLSPHPLRTLWVLLLGLSAGPALAQAGDCTITLSPDTVDFGALNRTTVGTANQQWLIGERDLQLSVACTVAGALNLRLQAPPSTQGGYLFGKDGRFELSVDSAVLDGSSVEIGTASAVGAAPGAIGAQTPWTEGTILLPVRAGAAASGSLFSARIRLRAFASAESAQASDQVIWDTGAAVQQADGSASRELRLAALFAPAACTLALNKNVVWLGTISARDLNSTTNTALPQDTSTTFAIDCDAPTRFALGTIDQRAGSSSSTSLTSFGLGKSPAGENIGSVSIVIPDPTDAAADPLDGAVSLNGQAPWARAGNLGPDHFIGFVRSGDPLAAGPSMLDHVTGTLQVSVVITRADALTLTSAVPIDGLITLELKYL